MPNSIERTLFKDKSLLYIKYLDSHTQAKMVEMLSYMKQRVKRLFTHEDGQFFHIHKILGFTVMAHFVYRMVMFAKYREMQFVRGSQFDAIMIAVHSLLHLTSFQFILSSKRNKLYNIIWPEMRWHSAIFAHRSILIWLLQHIGYLKEDDQAIRGARILIVMGVFALADFVTWYYKTYGKVDKEDSTMRGNPYPAYIPVWYQRLHNYFYSVSQVYATMTMLHSRNIDLVFISLLAIQTAPFGMTLVKKGFMTQGWWHVTYTMALMYNYYVGLFGLAVHTHIPYSTIHMHVIMYCIARFCFGINKYILWGHICGVYVMIAQSNPISAAVLYPMQFAKNAQLTLSEFIYAYFW